MFHFQGISQEVKRSPEKSKRMANHLYQIEYTLFDVWSDEPIFPQEDGRYHIYTASAHNLTPKPFIGSASELARFGNFKFKNLENCKYWCNAIPFNSDSLKKNSGYVSTDLNSQTTFIEPEGSLTFVDSIYKALLDLGKIWNKPLNEYDTVGIHNQFYFSEKGGPLTSKSELGKLNSDRSGIDYKNELDLFLKGLDVIVDHISNLEKEISTYSFPNCNNNLLYGGWERVNWNFEEIYFRLLSSTNILILNNELKPIESVEKLCLSCKKHSFGALLKNFNKCGNYIYTYYDLNSGVIQPYRKPCSKFEKKLKKEIKKKRWIQVEEADKKAFIKSVTGLDDKYFSLKKEIENCKQIIKIARSNFFKKLEAPSNYDNFLYCGHLSDGVPDGFGYLLGNNKKLILSAFWSKGIPITVYDLNIYHNTDIKWGGHKYLVSNGQGLCKNMVIDLLPITYKKENISTYNIYIGEYKSENDWGWSGFGSYFFEKWNKSDWSVYSGNWESSKYNGEGGFYNNGYKYSGDFQDGDLKNGKCIWPDKTTYLGDFQNFNMNGIGTLTYANGTVKYGYFQNNSFVKSYDDYVREINEQEERRIQEEQALEEKRKEQKVKDDYAAALFWKNMLERAAEYTASKTGSSSSTPSYSSQQNSQKPCWTCNRNPFKKPYKDDRCMPHSKEVSRPGYVLCSTCFGLGYLETNSPRICNCPGGGGWCYERDCYNSSCDDGWQKCSSCKGTGFD